MIMTLPDESGRTFNDQITDVIINDIRSHSGQDNLVIVMLGDNDYRDINPENATFDIIERAKRIAEEAEATVG